mgnify:CR=1 FL=1
MTLQITRAVDTDLSELAEVAASTFPMACPPSSPAADIATFIASHFTEEHFAHYLEDPNRVLFIARQGQILGYPMLIRGEPADADVAHAVPLRPTIELSKMYTVTQAHGTGAASALMAAAVDVAVADHARCIWLGVNQENQRAQRFYAKHGYTVSGTKTFRLGDRVEHDYVMVRTLP